MIVSDRPAVKRRIVEVLETADGLGGVKTLYDMEGAAAHSEAVWLGSISGPQEQVDFGTPRPGRDDRYTLAMVVAVTGFATTSDADARCQEIVTAVCEALFAGDRLGAEWKTVALYPGQIEGPNGFRLPKEPASSFAELTIEIVAPLRGV